MPYAMIPDGYTLKKVTNAQERAVSAKRKHDDVVAILSNPTAVKVIGAGTAALALGGLSAIFIPILEEKLGPLGEDFKTAIEETFSFLNPVPEISEFLSDLNPLKDDTALSALTRTELLAQLVHQTTQLTKVNRERREAGLTPYATWEEYQRALGR